MASAATWMDLEIIMPRSYSDSEMPTSYICYRLHVGSKKKGYNELLRRTETDSQTLKNLWLPKETGWWGEGWDGALGWKCCKSGL